MNRGLKLRSLLTTTSMFALIATAHGALASGEVVNPNGTTVDQILVTTTVDAVTNHGRITNDDGEAGIDVSGTVNGGVDNGADGEIDISGDHAIGIHVRQTGVQPGVVYDGIFNSGYIAATDTKSGSNVGGAYAAGIEVGDGGLVYGGFYNEGSLIAHANAASESPDAGTYSDMRVDSSAFGIRLQGLSETGAYGDDRNSGGIESRSRASLRQSTNASNWTDEEAVSSAYGQAQAIAMGIGVENHGSIPQGSHVGPVLASSVILSGSIVADAAAESYSSADAQAEFYVSGDCGCGGCYYSDTFAQGIVVDHATAIGNGAKYAGASAVIAGDVYSDGMIDARALAETQSKAQATSDSDDAVAYAGWNGRYYEEGEISSALAQATGLDIDVLKVGGNIRNYADIYVDANGHSDSTATAHASESGDAKAVASNYVNGEGRGIHVDAMLVSGRFENVGNIDVGVQSRSHNSASAVSGTDDADAMARGNAFANAIGIDVNVSVLGRGFFNGWQGWEDGIRAVATAETYTAAEADGAEEVNATASGVASAYATGIAANIDAISGHFVNTGAIAATANATGHQIATVTGGYDYAEAYANGEAINAYASGFYLQGSTLAGNFLNNGYVSARASARGVSTATANSLNDVTARAINNVGADALGVGLTEGAIQDNVANYGYIDVLGFAGAHQSAKAVSIEGSAWADAGELDDRGVRAGAHATGLRIETGNEDDSSGNIGGNIVNDANIAVRAQAEIVSLAQATGASLASAESRSYISAEAWGISARANSVGYSELGGWLDFESGSVRGYFINAEDVTVRADATVKATSSATAYDGNANAKAVLDDGYTTFACLTGCGSVNAEAHGIALYDADLRAGFANFGEVAVEAIGVGELVADASAYGEHDSDASVFAAGTMSSHAVGVELHDVYIDDDYGWNGEFYSGFMSLNDISARAVAKMNANADAYSEYGDATAEMPANFAGAAATGLLLDDFDSEDGFGNAEKITAKAFAEAKATAEARGKEEATALLANSASASAVGFSLDDSRIGRGIYNSGTIQAKAIAFGESLASAEANEATAAVGYDLGEAVRTNARAVGIFARDSEGHILNDENGRIKAFALARGDNRAEAYGDEIAHASAAGREYAEASGIDGEDYEDSGILNLGSIGSVAIAVGGQSAFASVRDEDGDTVSDADADDYASAHARGVFLTVTDFENEGYIYAHAGAYSEAVATALGLNGQAGAYASAWAAATGADLYFGEDASYFRNSGRIAAYARAEAQAAAFGSEDANADAYAEAYAVGVNIRSGSYLDSFSNSGEIYALAEAQSGGENDADVGSEAYAMGLRFSSANIFGDITNETSAVISANARASSEARAVGVELNDGSYLGALINDGSIYAGASALEAYATAISVTDGASLAGGIVNSGDIVAKVWIDDEEWRRGFAIDARDAGGALSIRQLGGRIVGDIRLDNWNSDTIEWSGGTISGDIHGDRDEDGDTLNIFAGNASSFVYADTIDGLSYLNVNGGDYIAPVTFRLTGTVRNVDNLNVGASAIMSLSTGANVSVSSLVLDRTGTLSFDIGGDDVTNAVINTSSADLGGGTVKAVFLNGLRPIEQTYRIINWDGSETQFGTVLSNSILEKVIAQYSEDGVDLVVRKGSFTDNSGLENDATDFTRSLDRLLDDIDPESPLGQALAQIALLSPAEYARVMNAIASQQIADIDAATFDQTSSLIHVIQTQISELRSGQIASNDLTTLGFRLSNSQLAALTAASPVNGKAAGSPIDNGGSVWARIFGDWASLDRKGARPGFTSTSGGVVVGSDYRFTDDLLAGLALGYQSTDVSFRGEGDGKVKSWSVTAYGDYKIGKAYVDMLLGYSMQSYKLDRYLSVLGVNYKANSDYDGSALAASVEAGYGFSVPGDATLSPFIGFNFTRSDSDAVTETGAGIWNLAYGSRQANSVESALGARLSKTIVTSGGTRLTPQVELGWKHEFGNASPTTSGVLAGTPGTNFKIDATDVSRDMALVGAALGVQLNDALDAYLQYNGQIASNYADNTASFRLRWKF